MKSVHLTLLLLLLFSAPPAGARSSQLRPVKVQLKWKHQFQFAGFYAAIDQGYYREAGLEVALVEGSPDTDFTSVVCSGEADFGVNITDLIVRRSRGEGVVILAPFFQHSPQMLAYRSDIGIQNPHNLAGRRVMLSPDGETAIVAMLKSEGLNLEQIDVINHSWNVEDLISGKVDAMSVYLTGEVFLLEKAGMDYKLLKPEHYGIDFYGDTLFTREQLLLSSPQLVHDFLEATLRGWRYALAHKAEMVELIIDTYGFSGSREQLLYEAEMIGQLMAEDIVEVGHSNMRRWESIIQVYDDLGMLDSRVEVDDLIYQRKTGLSILQQRVLNTSLIFLALSLLAALVLLLFNRNLKQEVAKRTGELKELNRELIDSLAEKEVLLREIHHRVKNNLQIISSLINLQHDNAKDPDSIRLRDRSMQRIQSMALVHEHLYKSEGLELIELSGYLEDLISLIFQSSRRPGDTMESSLQGSINTSIDISVPLGLIMVELLNNALRYGRNSEGNSVLQVILEQDQGNTAYVSVQDQGAGIDPGIFEQTNPETLGITLIQTLSRQIGASISVNVHEGTTISLRFPLLKPRAIITTREERS